MNETIKAMLAEVKPQRDRVTAVRKDLRAAYDAEAQRAAQFALTVAQAELAEAWNRAGQAYRQNDQARRLAAFNEAKEARLQVLEALHQAEKQDAARLHSAFTQAQRAQEQAFMRVEFERDLVGSEVSEIARAFEQYGPASAWQETKRLGADPFVAELPIHVLEPLFAYIEAEALPTPAEAAVADVQRGIAAGAIGDAMKVIREHLRFNWNDLLAEAERAAWRKKRHTARVASITTRIDSSYLETGQTVELRLHAERGDEAVGVSKATNAQPREAHQEARTAPDVANECTDTTSPPDVPETPVQHATADEATVIDVPDVADVPDVERLAIVALARAGLSRGKICEALYAARGGRAFSKVKAVLDAAGL